MSRKEPRRRRLGSLEVIEVHTSDGAPYVILFHGYGADNTDLAPLASMIPVGRPVNWIFPNGHISVPLGGHYEGRAWFPLRVSELEQAMATGTGVDLTKVAPPGMKRARENVFEMFRQLKVPLDRVVLGGFSQGAMVATDVTLHGEGSPAGLILLSSTLVDAETWRSLAPKRKGLPFFQSHGTHDAVLRIEPARQLATLLRESGWEGQLNEFGGQHEIPSEVLIRVGDFLRRVLPR